MGISNFCFPVRELSNERVKLVPFDTKIHAPEFFALSSPQPSLYAHIARGPYASLSDFTTNFLEAVIDPSPAWMLYAVIDKTRPSCSPTDDPSGALAGAIGYLDSSAEHLITEIGFVITLPPFQRTHVTSNAVGLLLQYALDSPERGGLGLRRVQWKANSVNAASRKVAERMGFVYEGMTRWERVFRDGVNKGKVGNGRGVPPGAKEGDLGRDTANFGISWEEWGDGGRERVRGVMER
ncbi:MAG: hypothetical protein L6R42_003524 [Xanthoria sp. 1 TBL-2021]|nr:MAG: hypothetical protein L6R42_003524 [Xanthoria sp. 1 TBL-2021]